MADAAPKTQEDKSAAGTATAEEKAAAEAAASEQLTVSKTEFEALKSGQAELRKMLNGIAAEKRVADKAKEAAAKTAASQGEETWQKAAQKLRAEMDEQRAVFDANLKAAESTFITSALKSFMAGESMDEVQAEGFEACLMQKYGDKITVKGAKVFFTDEFGEEKPFIELCKQFKATPLGKTFLTPVSTPGEVGNRTQQGVNRTAGVKDFNTMSPEEQRKNPRAAAAAIAQKYSDMAAAQMNRT